MSVIDFLAARRRNGEPAAEASTGTTDLKGRPTTQPLTASQFTRHVTHIVEDEMRRSLKKHFECSKRSMAVDCALALPIRGVLHFGGFLSFYDFLSWR